MSQIVIAKILAVACCLTLLVGLVLPIQERAVVASQGAAVVQSDDATPRTRRGIQSTRIKRSIQSARDHEIRELLNQSMDLVADNEMFASIHENLQNKLAINIVIDPNLEGVFDMDSEVAVNLRNIRLADGLRIMLREHDATYVVRDGVLAIISIDDEQEPDYLARQMVDVSVLLAWISKYETARVGNEMAPGPGMGMGPMMPHQKRLSAEDILISAITGIIDTDSWEVNGTGNGTVQCIGGVLVMNVSEAVGEKVQSLIKDLLYQMVIREN